MIDDSADKNRERVIISAALFGGQGEWRRLGTGWRKRLNEDQIDYFKSSDCKRLDGPFLKFRDPVRFPKPSGRETADRIENDLDTIIHSLELFGVGSVIPIPLWKQLKNDPIYAPVCAVDPYHWAVQTVWMQCAEAMKEMGRGNIIAFAHDKGENYPSLEALYLGYKAKNKTASRVFVSFAPLDDKTHPSIQAADVVASVTQKYALEWLDDPTTAMLKRLTASLYRISVWDDRFARLVLDSELKKRSR